MFLPLKGRKRMRGTKHPPRPKALGKKNRGARVDGSEAVLQEPTKPHAKAEGRCGRQEDAGPSQHALGSHDHGQGGHVGAVDVEVPDVKRQGQPRDEHRALHPQHRINAQNGMVGGRRGPNHRDEWNFEPRDFAQSAAHAGHKRVSHRGEPHHGHDRHPPGFFPPKFLHVSDIEGRPRSGPACDHPPLPSVPKSTPQARHVVRMPGVFDRPLHGVAQPRGQPHPHRDPHAAALHGKAIHAPQPTEGRGDKRAEGNPDVREREQTHGAKFASRDRRWGVGGRDVDALG